MDLIILRRYGGLMEMQSPLVMNPGDIIITRKINMALNKHDRRHDVPLWLGTSYSRFERFCFRYETTPGEVIGMILLSPFILLGWMLDLIWGILFHIAKIEKNVVNYLIGKIEIVLNKLFLAPA